MQLSIQSILLNVSDLERSLAFYTEVFDLSVDARQTEAAALKVSASDRRQVLVLRATKGTFHPGRGVIGPRLLAFEAGSLDEVTSLRLVLRYEKLLPDVAGQRAGKRSSDSTRTGTRSRSRPACPASR
jgi:catechol 2,3-dioxygenase-like lactoylglutathione lyase family enzyme